MDGDKSSYENNEQRMTITSSEKPFTLITLGQISLKNLTSFSVHILPVRMTCLNFPGILCIRNVIGIVQTSF